MGCKGETYIPVLPPVTRATLPASEGSCEGLKLDIVVYVCGMDGCCGSFISTYSLSLITTWDIVRVYSLSYKDHLDYFRMTEL